MKNRLILFVVALALAGVGFPVSPQETSPSGTENDKIVIQNSSFEEIEGDSPRGWNTTVRQQKPIFQVDFIGHTGKHSAKITSAEGTDSSWTTTTPVAPYSQYRLSGWIKTLNLKVLNGKGALLNVEGFDYLQTKPLIGTQEWTKVELVFYTEADDVLQINCVLGGRGKATGEAWFDDVQLELLSSKPLKPEVTIDTAKTLPPISPYIYGQFIEHLGRCIYQGIWAEMLEDRKFFYPVGGENSAWKIVGETSNFRMNPIVPYVGVHAPEVRLKGNGEGGGISQDHLAIIQGKNYAGRVVLAADPGALPVLVSLIWGPGENDRQVVSISEAKVDYATFPLSFKAGTSTDNARLEITGRGSEAFRLGTVSLMPADNIEGFRSDVLKLLKELHSPIYRWPGGNFVSGYNWKDGIGSRDRRPPRKNPAWQGVEHNDFGVHEYMELMRLLGAEPYITVNSGQGDEKLAADMVEYVNGAATTSMGQMRSQNGHPEPFGCKFWSIGNEMYGDWQLGHMPLKDYVKKHNRFAQAMQSQDPGIKLVAVGTVGNWDELMLSSCADNMTYISEHFYCGELNGLLSHVSQIPREVKRIAEAHRAYRRTIPALKVKNILIALDEWNYWYGPDLYGEIGVRYFLKDALGVARGLHEYIRQADVIFMANYAQTVNVIGAIKTSKTAAEFDTTGLVLKLYRAQFGTIPVSISGAPQPLDVVATWKEGKKLLTLAVVNPTRAGQMLSLNFKGLGLAKAARLWRITGKDEMAYNEPGKEPAVKIQETENVAFSNTLTLPPLSISLFELTF
jgi:alpha-N-arabinofuranosidase